jgi:8-oxo-dGTP pyrophosphatase MutT (NUDIX family)
MAPVPYRKRVEVYPFRRGSILTGLLSSGAPATFGGGIEEGETPEQAAAREVLEEALREIVWVTFGGQS